MFYVLCFMFYVEYFLVPMVSVTAIKLSLYYNVGWAKELYPVPIIAM